MSIIDDKRAVLIANGHKGRAEHYDAAMVTASFDVQFGDQIKGLNHDQAESYVRGMARAADAFKGETREG